MITVLLYGHLAQRFGKRFRLAVKSPAEAVRALCVNLPGFRGHLVKHSEPGYRVMVGKEAKDKDELRDPLGETETIKIIPVVAGAGPVGKAIVGAVLVVVGVVFEQPWMVNMGAAMIVSGVAEMLFAPPKTKSGENERPENKPSYAFDGPVNTAAQGNPVPVCYGRMIVGSQVVSAGLSVEQIAIGGSTPTAAKILSALHK